MPHIALFVILQFACTATRGASSLDENNPKYYQTKDKPRKNL